MTRVEENKMVVAEMEKKSESIPNGTYEEVTAFQFGVIATMLTDISKSLAVIADGEESKASIDIVNEKILDMLEEFDLKLSEYEDADLIRVDYIRQDIQEKIDSLKEK